MTPSSTPPACLAFHRLGLLPLRSKSAPFSSEFAVSVGPPHTYSASFSTCSVHLEADLFGHCQWFSRCNARPKQQTSLKTYWIRDSGERPQHSVFWEALWCLGHRLEVENPCSTDPALLFFAFAIGLDQCVTLARRRNYWNIGTILAGSLSLVHTFEASFLNFTKPSFVYLTILFSHPFSSGTLIAIPSI